MTQRQNGLKHCVLQGNADILKEGNGRFVHQTLIVRNGREPITIARFPIDA